MSVRSFVIVVRDFVSDVFLHCVVGVSSCPETCRFLFAFLLQEYDFPDGPQILKMTVPIWLTVAFLSLLKTSPKLSLECK